MIQVQNITKTFDGFRALDDLSFTVPHGAVYGLVGPNGAGKSTVLRCITGIYRPDSGTVTAGCRSGKTRRSNAGWPSSRMIFPPMRAIPSAKWRG